MKALICLCILSVFSLSSQSLAAGTKDKSPKVKTLIELEPESEEYGTVIQTDGVETLDPGKLNFGSWSAGGFWPGNRKIVKSIPKDAALPPGTEYDSMSMLDFFAVGGEFVPGVGLLTRMHNAYYWIEYKIPSGAKTFNADIMISDDVAGYTRGYNYICNQQFAFRVFIDGKPDMEVPSLRQAPGSGSGTLVKTISIPLPKDAKTIRFMLQSSPWGDGNYNIELVLKDGQFEF